MKWLQRSIAIAVWAAACSLIGTEPGSAHTSEFVTRQCPFTGTTFAALVDASGTQFCMRLDLKPIGPLGVPPAVPVCPDDGFVVFKPKFTNDEIDRLRPWIQSEAFREMTRNESTYRQIAETLRKLGEPHDAVAWALVRASWQAENDEDKYRRYVSEAIAELAIVAAGPHSTNGDRRLVLEPDVAGALAGELERRMGRLERARAEFQELKQKPGVSGELLAIIDWELELVAAGDPGAHYLPRESEERCKEDEERAAEDETIATRRTSGMDHRKEWIAATTLIAILAAAAAAMRFRCS